MLLGHSSVKFSKNNRHVIQPVQRVYQSTPLYLIHYVGQDQRLSTDIAGYWNNLILHGQNASISYCADHGNGCSMFMKKSKEKLKS